MYESSFSFLVNPNNLNFLSFIIQLFYIFLKKSNILFVLITDKNVSIIGKMCSNNRTYNINFKTNFTMLIYP